MIPILRKIIVDDSNHGCLFMKKKRYKRPCLLNERKKKEKQIKM